MELLDEFDVREICATCTVITLPRSRHCIICNACIDRFDHHCQWLNNCIGRRNHGYFIVFVLIQSLYLLFVAGALLTAYILFLKSDEHELGLAF